MQREMRQNVQFLWAQNNHRAKEQGWLTSNKTHLSCDQVLAVRGERQSRDGLSVTETDSSVWLMFWLTGSFNSLMLSCLNADCICVPLTLKCWWCGAVCSFWGSARLPHIYIRKGKNIIIHIDIWIGTGLENSMWLYVYIPCTEVRV